jgi:hypothetical protein
MSVERDELAQIFHGVEVEVDLIGNTEPHMRWCPPSHAFDIQVMVQIDVVRGTVTAARPTSE